MKTLLILRHAKSSSKQPETTDHDRPLNARGKRDAPRMGQLVLNEDLTPDLIISSTAKRARHTAQMIARTCGYERTVLEVSTLYHAGPDMWLTVLRNLPETCKRPMIVGHNPGLEDLLRVLTGTDRPLPTAALAQVDADISEWSSLQPDQSARCVCLWLP